MFFRDNEEFGKKGILGQPPSTIPVKINITSMSKIAILSDTHDQVANLRSVVKFCNKKQIGHMIHCGDLISPFMLKELGQLNGEVHLIYGNNMGDLTNISAFCQTRFTNVTHHGPFGEIRYAGLRIGFVHYPHLAEGLASQGSYDVVCYGHNHKQQTHRLGSTLLINPGQLLGEDNDAGFTVLNSSDLCTSRYRIGNCMFDHPITVRVQEEVDDTTDHKETNIRPIVIT